MMLGKHSTNWAKFSALSFICLIKASYVSSPTVAPEDGLSQSSVLASMDPSYTRTAVSRRTPRRRWRQLKPTFTGL